jgi:hypothetical protein
MAFYYPSSLKKLQKLLNRTLNDSNPSEETIEKHFEFIRTVVKNETSLVEIENLKDFAHFSHIHFSKFIKRKGTAREETLDEQYKKTLEEVSRRNDKLRVTGKATSFKAQVGQTGVELGQSVEKVPPRAEEAPKKEHEQSSRKFPKEVDTV